MVGLAVRHRQELLVLLDSLRHAQRMESRICVVHQVLRLTWWASSNFRLQVFTAHRTRVRVPCREPIHDH